MKPLRDIVGSLFFIFVLIGTNDLVAQTSGVVEYKIVVNNHKNLTPDQERFKKFTSEFDSSFKYLFYSESECLYFNKPKEVDEISESRGYWSQGRVSDDRYYRNFETNESIEQVEFLDKRFLIIDTIKFYHWKLTSESKSVGGVICIKAILVDTNGTSFAWFAPSIPIQAGPLNYSGLPGLILEMSLNDSTQVIRLVNLEQRVLEKNEFAKPKSGKKVSRAEFDAIREKKLKERQSQK